MNNFVFYSPTEFVFGKNTEVQVGALARKYGAQKVMIVYGGGSVVRSGLLDRVKQYLQEAGVAYCEMGGVQPNPIDGKVYEGIQLCRREQVDMMLPVGGGSVIDTAKAIAAGALYDGDFWDFFIGRAKVEKALKVAVVLTIPAAGSEGSGNTVITKTETLQKLGLCAPEHLRPVFSIMNPELTYTLPAYQTACGIADMMAHIMERYFTNTPAVDYTTAQAEAALRVIMEQGPKLMTDSQDYDAWAQIGLAGSFAHNGYFGLGFEEDWACHGIEHAISGWDAEITHGAGLAVVTPAWLSYVWSANPQRVLRFAHEVLGVNAPEGTDPEQVVKLAVAKLTSFLMVMNLPTRLHELTDKEVPVKEIAAAAAAGGTLGHFKPLTQGDIEKILMLAA